MLYTERGGMMVVVELLCTHKTQENTPCLRHERTGHSSSSAQMQGNDVISRAARKWSLAAVWRNEEVVNGAHNLMIELGGQDETKDSCWAECLDDSAASVLRGPARVP